MTRSAPPPPSLPPPLPPPPSPTSPSIPSPSPPSPPHRPSTLPAEYSDFSFDIFVIENLIKTEYSSGRHLSPTNSSCPVSIRNIFNVIQLNFSRKSKLTPAFRTRQHAERNDHLGFIVLLTEYQEMKLTQ